MQLDQPTLSFDRKRAIIDHPEGCIEVNGFGKRRMDVANIIVKSCNCHVELIKALEACENQLAYSGFDQKTIKQVTTALGERKDQTMKNYFFLNGGHFVSFPVQLFGTFYTHEVKRFNTAFEALLFIEGGL